MHTEKPIFTAQFHPEAFGGPTDTEVTIMWLCYLSQQIKSEKLICFSILNFEYLFLLSSCSTHSWILSKGKGPQ